MIEFLKKAKNQTFVKDLAMLFTDRCMQLVGQLFNIFILTKYLGPSKFGILMYSISIWGFLLNVSSMGMDRVLVVEFSRNGDKLARSNTILSGILIKFSTSAAILAMLYFGHPVMNTLLSDDVYTVLCFLSWGLLFSIWQIADAYNQSIGMFKNTARARIITVVTIILAKVALIYLHAGFHTVVWVFAIEQFICLLMCLVLSPQFIKALKSIKFRNFKFQAGILKSGFFVMVSTAFVLVYFRTSQVIIENRFSSVYLGLFSLVIYLVEMPVSLASIMSTVFTPKLAVRSIKENNEINLEYARVLLVFFIVGIVSVAILVIVGIVLSNLLGAEYNGFYSMLLQSLIAIPLIFTGYFSYMVLLSSKKFRQYLFITLLGGTASLIYLYLARNYYTTSNAVYLYVLSQFIASFLIPILMQKELRVSIKYVFGFILNGSVFRQIKSVNNMFQ